MTGHVVLVTWSEGHWHAITGPSNRTLEAVARLEGSAVLIEVDPARRAARLLRVIRGDGAATLAGWCRRNGLRPIVPAPAPDPMMLAGHPRPLA
jgi:hypothetical protein